jgi:hypothetical protein
MTTAKRPTALDDLLDQARQADPAHRIEFRNAIALHGEAAIDAMTDLLGDERLAAFAIRVLERIGQVHLDRPAVVTALRAVNRQDLPDHLAGDLDWALNALGADPSRAPARSSASGSGTRSVGSPGAPGRGYWVMRTSPWERAYVWTEATHGRLRQGWGWNAEMNLDVIADVVRRSGELSDEQRASLRSRRMNTSAPDGMRLGDLVVAPNLPEWGQISVFRVVGSYTYSLDSPRQFDERFGHVLPVELLASAIDRRGSVVSDGLRAMLRVQTRLYNIGGYGGDVERLIGNDVTGPSVGDRWGELWTEHEYEVLFGRFPPTGSRPSDDDIAALAAELGRTFDAISWQWGDGAAYCSGGSASTTSEPLKSWLHRTGACG